MLDYDRLKYVDLVLLPIFGIKSLLDYESCVNYNSIKNDNIEKFNKIEKRKEFNKYFKTKITGVGVKTPLKTKKSLFGLLKKCLYFCNIPVILYHIKNVQYVRLKPENDIYYSYINNKMNNIGNNYSNIKINRNIGNYTSNIKKKYNPAVISPEEIIKAHIEEFNNRCKDTFIYNRNKKIKKYDNIDSDIKIKKIVKFFDINECLKNEHSIFGRIVGKTIDINVKDISELYDAYNLNIQFCDENDNIICIDKPIHMVMKNIKSTNFNYEIIYKKENINLDENIFSEQDTIVTPLCIMKEIILSFDINELSDIFDKINKVKTTLHYPKYKNDLFSICELDINANNFHGTIMLPFNNSPNIKNIGISNVSFDGGNCNLENMEVEISITPRYLY